MPCLVTCNAVSPTDEQKIIKRHSFLHVGFDGGPHEAPRSSTADRDR